ncbi:MAG: hypothetical protein K0Q55_4191, partial [Verrucomicrobia bacterium]|nr:hypothetical protein [Verrucomicrobiota bacterium]
QPEGFQIQYIFVPIQGINLLNPPSGDFSLLDGL